MSEPMPCPLDKGQATMTGKHLDERCGYGYEVTIRCKTCGCSVTRGNTSNDAGWNDEPSAQTEARAIAAWNTRPAAQAVAVDDALDARLWRLFLAHRDNIETNAIIVGDDAELIAAIEQAAMGGEDV